MRQDKNGAIRIIQWSKKATSWTETAQWLYYLRSPTQSEELGLTELVHLDGLRFLSLERGYTPPVSVVGDVYLTDCSKASNIAKVASIKNRDFKSCIKTPLIHLNDFQKQLKFYTQIDNVEGMTLVKQGNKNYIVIASDDNFRSTQRNQLLVFEWKREK